MNCQECKDNRLQTADVPYIVHEGMLARMERANKRLWVILIIVIVLFVGTVAGWIYYENQFEDQYVEQDIDTGNGDAIVAGIGDIHYGEDTSSNTNKVP